MHVVVLSYNHPQLTINCLRSLVLKIKPQNITLVHNGTGPKVIEGLRSQFPEVHHLSFQQNLGFCQGANRGLAAGFQKSDWVLFVSNDCQLISEIPEWDQEPGLIGPLVWARKKGKVDSILGAFDWKRATLRHFKSEEEMGQWRAQRGSFQYVPGSCFFIHKDVFEKTKGFDESFGTYWEDVDLSYRWQKAGGRIAFDPRIEVLHGVGKTCHKSSHYTLFLFQRNRRRFLWRYLNQENATKFEGLRRRIEMDLILAQLSLRLAKKKRWKDLKLLPKIY